MSLASDDLETRNGDGESSFRTVCDEWVNFSSFLARCIEAGLLDHLDNRCRYPSIDIPHGLEKDLPRGPMRDCKVMTAAQYFLLAGRTLADDCFKESAPGLAPEKWRVWAGKLGEISRQEGSNNRLASATEEARNHMVSLRPESSLASGNGGKDVAEPPEEGVSQG